MYTRINNQENMHSRVMSKCRRRQKWSIYTIHKHQKYSKSYGLSNRRRRRRRHHRTDNIALDTFPMLKCGKIMFLYILDSMVWFGLIFFRHFMYTTENLKAQRSGVRFEEQKKSVFNSSTLYIFYTLQYLKKK